MEGKALEIFRAIKHGFLPLTSKYEGLPNVLIEAQYRNIPIISSDCPTGPREILMNGKLGELFNVGDYKGLCTKILEYTNNRKKLKTDLIKKTLSTGGISLIYSQVNIKKNYIFKNNLPLYYIHGEKNYIKIIVSKKIIFIKDNIKNLEKVAYKIWNFILIDRYKRFKLNG